MTSTDVTCLISSLKDEGPWLLEWIAHNHAVGFDRMVVASNDCSDGTDAMLDRLQEIGYLRHVANPGPYPRSVQSSAFERIRATGEVSTAAWVMALDGDEFLNIHLGTGQIRDLIASHDPDVDAITVCWRIFGDSGQTEWADLPVCESFLMANDNPRYWTQAKTLFRTTNEFQSFEAHGPWLPPPDAREQPLKVRTADNRYIRRDLFDRPDQMNNVYHLKRNWNTAQINHYLVKTRDVYDLKIKRGRGLGKARRREKSRHTAEFFERMNCNHVQDRSIERTAETRNRLLAELKSDPVLARLHSEACENLRSRIAARNADLNEPKS